MTGQNCMSCRHFHGKDLGVCRRYPVYQMRHENEVCGEFAEKAVAKPLPDSDESGVFSHMERQLLELPVLEDPPKRRGRPKK